MPSYRCVVCQLSSRFVKSKNLSISFHGFPSDPDKKQAWKEFCGTDTGVVCSEHFSDDCFLGAREEKNKRRRLVNRAVPTLRFSVTTHGTRILSTTYSQENDPSYFGVQPMKEDFSEEDFSQSFDYIAEEDMSEEDAVSAKDDIISDLRSQVAEYKTQLEDTTKKLNEMEEAIFDRDCIIEDLRKKLDDVQNGLLPDQIKIEIND
ncbi:THAP domain-containing protein 2-like [Culex quinquefasciatus]|uniref:THAP domain-containing protein 2-like n=1 Tax=Culex quinquefasciatus TaxID=7176 RepID=UPI0018E38302|nr:THAP domain-containing protein 2-like [Culex quinquefasciatus]